MDAIVEQPLAFLAQTSPSETKATNTNRVPSKAHANTLQTYLCNAI